MCTNIAEVDEFQNNPLSFLSQRRLTEDDFIIDSMKTLLNEQPVPFRMRILQVLASHSFLLFTEQSILEQTLATLIDLYDRCVPLRQQILITMTTICISTYDIIAFSRSFTSDDSTNAESEVSSLLLKYTYQLQSLLMDVSQDRHKEYNLKRTALHCLTELEICIPCLLTATLRSVLFPTIFEKRLGGLGQEWRILTLVSARNMVQSAESGIAGSVQSRVLMAPGSNRKLSSFFLSFGRNTEADSQSRVNEMCLRIGKELFRMSSAGQSLALSQFLLLPTGYCPSADSLLGNVDSWTDSTSLLLQHAALRILLTVRLSDEDLLKYSRKFHSICSHDEISHSRHLFTLKLYEEFIRRNNLTNHRLIRPLVVNNSLVTLEKIFINSSIYSSHKSFSSQKFMQLVIQLSKPVHYSSHISETRPFFKALFFLCHCHQELREDIFELLLAINIENPQLSSLIAEFLFAVKIVLKDQQYVVKFLCDFVQYITGEPLVRIVPNLQYHCLILQIAAAEPSVDFERTMDMLEAILINSFVCQTGDLHIGWLILEVIRALLQSASANLYYDATESILSIMGNFFNNDLIRDAAMLYYKLMTSFSFDKLKDLFIRMPHAKVDIAQHFQMMSLEAKHAASRIPSNLKPISTVAIQMFIITKVLLMKKSFKVAADPSDIDHAKSEIPDILDINNAKILKDYLESLSHHKVVSIPCQICLNATAIMNSQNETNSTHLDHVFAIEVHLMPAQYFVDGSRAFLDGLKIGESKTINFNVVVNEPVPMPLSVWAMFTDKDLNEMYCELSAFQIEIEDMFLPLPCFQKELVFYLLWRQLLQNVGDHSERAIESLISLDVPSSANTSTFTRFVYQYLSAFCVTQVNSIDSDSKYGVFIPPRSHVLFVVKPNSKFLVIHFVVSDWRLLKIIFAFFKSLEERFEQM